jgi:hypothetical protein
MHVLEEFPRRPDQIPRGRSFVRSTLQDWDPDARPDDVVLVTSELFTTAVLHGDGGVQLRLERQPGCIRLDMVHGGDPQAPMSLAPVEGLLPGGGLAIVQRLASAWGSARAGNGGTRVWAQIPLR